MSMCLLPNTLINSLERLPSNVPVAGLIRHAEREPFVRGEFGHEVNLTANGRISCQQLGKRLDKQLVGLYTSPVKRCYQTAQWLGFLPIQTSEVLGDPGIFITDPHRAHFYCRQQEPFVIVQQLLANQKNPPGFCHSTSKAVFNLIQFLLVRLVSPGLSLFITHDSILSVVLGTFFDTFSLEWLWPTYLDGVFFWMDKGQLAAVYKGNHKILHDFYQDDIHEAGI